MGSARDELAIIDETGGPLMAAPLLLLLEFCFASVFVDGLRGNIADTALLSATWRAVEFVSSVLTIANGILLAVIFVTGFRTFGHPAYLRINQHGIWLPYGISPIRMGRNTVLPRERKAVDERGCYAILIHNPKKT